MGGFDDYALADGPAVGPTGAVSWARHKATGQAVAVTELDAAVAGDQAFLVRLRATAVALTKVGHPNVLPIREVVEGDGRVWVVEDWVDGRELGEILGDGRLTAEQSVALTDGVLRALVAVHGKGVVHGDVSTASIVVAADGVPRLVGFGFNGLPGRPAADADADVLATGVVLRDLLAGGARHQKLEAVVERATSARPKDRPKHAAALLALVEKAARSDFGKGWEAKPSLAQRAAAASVETTEELVGRAGATLTEPLPAVSDPTADELDALDELDQAVEADASATELELDEPGGPAANAVEELPGVADADRPESDATLTDGLEPAESGDAADDRAAATADATSAFAVTESGLTGESAPPSADDADPAAADDADPAAADFDAGAGPGGQATDALATPAPAKSQPAQTRPSKGAKAKGARSKGKKHRKGPTPTTPTARPTETPTAAAVTTSGAATPDPAGTPTVGTPATQGATPATQGATPATATPTPTSAASGRAGKKSPPKGAKKAQTRKRRERRPPSPAVVRGLAGVIMILIGAGTAVAVDRNAADEVNRTASSGTASEPGSNSTGEVPTPVQIAGSDITGAWTMRLAVFESTGFFGTQVGQTVEKTYTIRSDCSVTPCALKLTVTDPVGEFDLRRQAEEYVVAVSGPQDCIVLSTGVLQVPNAGVASVSVHLRPTSAIRTPRGGWSATGLSGSIVTTFDTSNPGCTQGSGVQRSTAVGTRQ